MSRFFSSKYKNLVPYVPGEQPKDMKYVKLNTNESPFAPPESVTKAALEAAKGLQLYSDPTCSKICAKLAQIYGVKPSQVMADNGSDEGLYFSFLAFCDKETPAAFADITYGFYPVFAEFTGTPYEIIPLKDDFTIDAGQYMGIKKTIFIANPNAPTGIALPLQDIEKIAATNPDNVVVIDEAYVDFGAESAVKLIDRYDNLLVIRTFSKSRSMAGARLGFVMGNEELINDLNSIRYSTNPYNVNSMTLAAGLEYLNCEEYMQANCKKIIENREYTTKELVKMGFCTTNSKTNFIFAVHPELDGNELYLELKRRGVLVRHFGNERICQYIRITVGTREQMDILLKELKDILGQERK